jgi:succinate dehydrogenase / fumarate reductase cytochrome b subunit
MLRRDAIIDLPGAGPATLMSTAAAKKQRPKYLSLAAILFQIRLPVPGWVSILHRVSGALLVFPFTAWMLYLLDASLRSGADFARIREYLDMPLAKLGLLLLIWACCHHFCAGLRYLVLDLNRGIELGPARFSAVAVLVVSLLATVVFGTMLW